MRVYRVIIHKRKPTPKNPAKFLIQMYQDDDDFGAWLRCLRHKGVEFFKPIAERSMTPSEKENIDTTWRLHFINYMTWEGLVCDEYRVTGDEAWITELCAYEKLDPIAMIKKTQLEDKQTTLKLETE